jgi:hypothetical protein
MSLVSQGRQSSTAGCERRCCVSVPTTEWLPPRSGSHLISSSLGRYSPRPVCSSAARCQPAFAARVMGRGFVLARCQVARSQTLTSGLGSAFCTAIGCHNRWSYLENVVKSWIYRPNWDAKPLIGSMWVAMARSIGGETYEAGAKPMNFFRRCLGSGPSEPGVVWGVPPIRLAALITILPNPYTAALSNISRHRRVHR